MSSKIIMIGCSCSLSIIVDVALVVILYRLKSPKEVNADIIVHSVVVVLCKLLGNALFRVSVLECLRHSIIATARVISHMSTYKWPNRSLRSFKITLLPLKLIYY